MKGRILGCDNGDAVVSLTRRMRFKARNWRVFGLAVAALALAMSGGAQARGSRVTLPLKLGLYEVSLSLCHHHEDSPDVPDHIPIYLDKNGYEETDTSDAGVFESGTFLAVTKVGQNRYQIRSFADDSDRPRRAYFTEVWEIPNPTSFNIMSEHYDKKSDQVELAPSFHPITYHYCGPSLK